MSKKIFVNLPVKDMAASRELYAQMGFSINESYSNEQATFVVIEENINLILISPQLFKENALRDVADTTAGREVSVAIQLDTIEDVDRTVEAAVAAGATEEGEKMDDDVIYSRGLCDLDGHRLDINCLKS